MERRTIDTAGCRPTHSLSRQGRAPGCKAVCCNRDWRERYTTAGHRRCAGELLAAEEKARTGRLGLWTEAAYQVRSGRTPAELLRYRTTFQLVEGGIDRVAVVRGVIYLNFDRNWRQAFSVSLRQVDRAVLGEAYARNPKGLEGKTVRVRGWVEQRGSAPAIDLSSAGNIEVLEKDPGDRVGGR